MLTRYVLLDLETIALPDAAEWLPKVEAPANYTKQISIDAYVQGETLKALDRAALDPDCCRIICAGWQGPLDAEPQIRICTTDQQEIETLTTLWERRIELVDAMWQAPPFLGYG